MSILATFSVLFQDEFNRPLRETEELQAWSLLLSPACSTGGQRSEDSLGEKLPLPSFSLSLLFFTYTLPVLPGFLLSPSLHRTAGISLIPMLYLPYMASTLHH